MSWLIFVILSVVLITVISLFEKYFLSHLVKDPRVLVAIGSFGFFLFSFLLIFFIDLSLTWAIVPAILGGIAHYFALYFYYDSLSKEDVSKVIPILSIMGVFVLILSYFLFSEVFTLIEYLGIFSLLLGTFIISMKGFSLPKFGKVFYFLILAAFLFAVRTILNNYAVMKITPLEFLFWMGFGALIVAGFFAFKKASELKKVKKENLLGFGFVSFLAVLLMYTLSSALQLGTVTLTFMVYQTHIFFVFLLVTIISIFSPKSFKEDLNKWVILQKAIAITLIFVGSILIL